MESSPDPQPERRRFFTRRRLIRWSLFLTALVPVWLLISFVVARQLTRRPRALFEEPTPHVAWAKFHSLRLDTSDGQNLGAWYAEGTRSEAPSVILLHGNGGQRAHTLGRAELLASQGCAVLPVTLRAHGDSSGDINDIGYSARHDVVAAVEFLERKRPGQPILILGTSMGAAAATFASGILGNRVAGYILEAPYLDLKVAVRNRTSNALPIGLEWVAYQGLVTVAPYILPDLEKISPRQAIAGIPDAVPILIITGREDRKSTPEQVEILFDRVRSHARMVVFEKAGHLHYHETDHDLYRSEILDFVFHRSRNDTAISASANTSQ
jgi:uncharacterized protein